MQALADLLGSSIFQTNSRLPRLLRYLVTTTIDGRGDSLKAYVIATDALGRGIDFDPASDSIVRVEVNRLRQSLAHYYATEGANSSVRIEIPKGQYRPQFTKMVPLGGQSTTTGRIVSRRPALWAGGIAALTAIVFATTLFVSGPSDLSDQPDVSQGRENPAQRLSSNPAYRPPPSGRPGLPRVFIAVAPDDDLASDARLAIESAVTKFANISVLTTDELPSPWPEDYRITISTIAGSDVTTVYLQLAHLRSQELIESREIVVGATADAGLAAADIERLQELAADLVSRGGALEQDYRRRGDYSPIMRCELLALDYFARQTAAAHLAARDCAEAEIAAGNRASLLYVALALLHTEEYVDGLNIRPGDPLQRALRAANSATNREPSSSFGYFAQMMVHSLSGDVDATMRAGQVAVSLNPLDADILAAYAMRLSYFGRPDEALEMLRRAEQLQPSTRRWREYAFFLSHYQLGQMSQATGRARILAGAIDPHYIAAEAIGAWITGDAERARMLIDQLAAIAPDFINDPRASYRRRHYAPALIEQLVADVTRASGVASDEWTSLTPRDSTLPGAAQDQEPGRPSVPRLFVVAESSDVRAISVALAIEAAASRFSLLRVVSQATSVPDPAVAWPEDYAVVISTAEGDDQAALLLRIVHAGSGDLVDTREFLVPREQSDMLDLLENDDLQRVAAELVRRRGLIEQDYRRRGAHSETMACALLFSDFLDTQDVNRYQTTRACVEARIAAGDREPYLRVISAVLHVENFVRGFDEQAGDALDLAFQEVSIAVNLDPNSAPAHFVQAWIHGLRNETNAMVRLGERAVGLNPLDADMLAGLGMRLAFAGRYTDAVGLLERAEYLQPGAQRWRDYALFVAYYGLNDMQRAAVRAQMLAGSSVPTHMAARTVIAWKMGDTDTARELAGELLAVDPLFGDDPSAIYVRRNYAPELSDRLTRDLIAAGLSAHTAH